MGRHGTEMAMMLWPVMLLDASRIGPLAEAIGAPREFEEDEDLLRVLPPEFFVIESQVGARAQEMARLARSPNPDSLAIAASYGALVGTCVQCHAVYLKGPSPTATTLGLSP